MYCLWCNRNVVLFLLQPSSSIDKNLESNYKDIGTLLSHSRQLSIYDVEYGSIAVIERNVPVWIRSMRNFFHFWKGLLEMSLLSVLFLWQSYVAYHYILFFHFPDFHLSMLRFREGWAYTL